jgi:hypothetical protein
MTKISEMKASLNCIISLLAIIFLTNLSCTKTVEKQCPTCPSPKMKRAIDITADNWHAVGDSLYWTEFGDTLTKLSGGGYTQIDTVFLIVGQTEYNLSTAWLYSVVYYGYLFCPGTNLQFIPINKHGPMPFKTLSLKVVIN